MSGDSLFSVFSYVLKTGAGGLLLCFKQSLNVTSSALSSTHMGLDG